MERRKFNLSAWVAVGLAGFLAIASTISAFSITQYKVDAFAKQAAVDRAELMDFRKLYMQDQRRNMDDISTIKQSVARIEEAIKNIQGKK